MENQSNMFLATGLTLKFPHGEEKIKEIFVRENGEILINNSVAYKRILLGEEDLVDFKYFQRGSRKMDYDNIPKELMEKPFFEGEYAVEYNGREYRMSYLDEFELFKLVVVGEEYKPVRKKVGLITEQGYGINKLYYGSVTYDETDQQEGEYSLEEVFNPPKLILTKNKSKLHTE